MDPEAAGVQKAKGIQDSNSGTKNEEKDNR